MTRALLLAILLCFSVLARAEELVDLNAATVDQLEKLPGIGPSKAKAIVDDRSAKGPFTSVDDLDRVKGIGPKMIDRLRSHVKVGAKAAAKPPPAKAPEKPAKQAVSAPAPAAAPPPGTEKLDRESPEGKLNLNLATEEELQQIDGISKGNAKIIVAWRRQKGPFRHIGELAGVPGLPPKLLQTVQYFVTVRFDANAVKEADLVASGIPREAAASVVAARQKHGKLSAADLAKLPGVSAEDRAALEILLWFP